MNIEQLTGRCSRLKQELLAAYATFPCNRGRIERLTDELAVTEREIAAMLSSQRSAIEDLRDAA